MAKNEIFFFYFEKKKKNIKKKKKKKKKSLDEMLLKRDLGPSQVSNIGTDKDTFETLHPVCRKGKAHRST